MKSSHARAALLFSAALIALAVLRTVPSMPAHGVADDQFSGRRAYTLLGRLYAGARPHPVGSTANMILRERISFALRRLGYYPRTQREFVCNRWGTCATVENIIAELPGRENGKSVVLMSHYDSVPAGPGVGDDGSGVAITLEVARILKREEPPRNTVVFLITDGEEAGLLGAQAFVEHEPAAKNIGAVVNLEARGTGGNSYMFETNRDNAWVVALLGRALSRPATSSLFYEMYKRLPNDTDFSVLKRAGIQGTNFAFIGGALRYHTPLDDLHHLSDATLEQQGENALAMLRAFAAADLTETPRGDATYFDFLQFLILAWPASLSIWIAAATLALLALQVFVLARKGVVAIGSSIAAAGSVLAAAVTAGILGYGGTLVLRASHAFPGTWVARPGAAVVFFWLVGVVTAMVPALVWLRRDRVASFWAGSGFLFCALAIIASAATPGVSFLFAAPAAAYVITASLWLAATDGAGAGRWVAPVVGVAASLVPVTVLGYQGMGLVVMPGVSLFASLIATTFAIPLLVATPLRGRMLLVVGSLAIAAAVVAAVLPPWAPDAPRPLNFIYDVRADGTARWLSASAHGPLPDPVARAASWSRAAVAAFPESAASYYEAAAAPMAVRTLGIESSSSAAAGGRRSARLVLRNIAAGAGVAVLMHDRDSIESVTVNGVTVPLEARKRVREWTTIRILATPKGEAELNILTTANAPLDTIVRQIFYSLPPAGAVLLKARPADAAPVQNGDTTLVTQYLTL